MGIRQFPILVLFVFFNAIPLWAADPGSVGFNFLKVSPGARHAAMGDVGVSLTSNLFGAYFNPAVISGADHASVGFMHHEGIFDTRREFLGGSAPMLGGVVALGFDYFKVGDIEARDNPTEEPLNLFDAQDWLVSLSYALQFNEKFSLGVTGKYAAEKIDTRTADAIMADAGVHFRPTRLATLGFAVRHLGSKPSFSQEEIEIPVTVTGGAGIETNGLTVAGEVAAPKESDLRFNLGAEKLIGEMFALRGGYKIGYDEENFSAGAGFTKSIWQVDYAFIPYKSGLGSTHRFALTINLK